MVHKKHAEILLNFRRMLHHFTNASDVLGALPVCLGELFGADQVLLHTIDSSPYGEDSFSLKSKEQFDLAGSILQFKGCKIEFLGKALQLPIIINEVKKSSVESTLKQALRSAGIKSFMAVLLQDGQRVLGWIECYFKRNFYSFTKEDLRALEQAVSDCTFYLEQIAEATNRKLDFSPIQSPRMHFMFDLLREVSDVLKSSSEPTIIILNLLQFLLTTTQSDFGYGCLLNQDASQLELSAAIGLDEKQLEQLETALATVDTLSQSNLLRCQIITSNECSKGMAEDIFLPKEGISAKLQLPLCFGRERQLLGSISLFSKNGDTFSDLGLDLFEIVAIQAALGLRWANDFANRCRRHSSGLTSNRSSQFVENSIIPAGHAKTSFEALVESERNRIAGLIASGVAHNFNNLLQGVMGQASLIERQASAGSPIIRSARMIVESAGKGASLVSQLSTLSNHIPKGLKLIDVNQMLRLTESNNKKLLGPSVDFESRLASDEALVKVNPMGLQQVIDNILLNAKEAISDDRGGSVIVSTNYIFINVNDDPILKQGEYVAITIADNGRGMSQEQISRCFDPFYTTKDVDLKTGLGVGGIGLGLSIAYAITRQYGGKITINSSLNCGSEFSIFLPRYEGEKEDEELDYSKQQRKNVDMPLLARISGFDEKTGRALRRVLLSFSIDTLIYQKPADLCTDVSKIDSPPSVVILDADSAQSDLLLLEGLARIDRAVCIMLATFDAAHWRKATRTYRDKIEVIRKPVDALVLQNILRKVRSNVSL